MTRSVQSYIHRTFFVGLHIIIALFIFRFFVMSVGVVEGQSMEPTLYSGDIFAVNTIAYLVRTPDRYEVVQIHSPEVEEATNIKRVLGLPGETVSIRRNRIIVTTRDGRDIEIEEKYLDPQTVTRVLHGAQSSWEVPEHSYFLMGDNRTRSADSRDWGPVHRRHILGKVVVR